MSDVLRCFHFIKSAVKSGTSSIDELMLGFDDLEEYIKLNLQNIEVLTEKLAEAERVRDGYKQALSSKEMSIIRTEETTRKYISKLETDLKELKHLIIEQSRFISSNF